MLRIARSKSTSPARGEVTSCADQLIESRLITH
jgi:hypothetical protein